MTSFKYYINLFTADRYEKHFFDSFKIQNNSSNLKNVLFDISHFNMPPYGLKAIFALKHLSKENNINLWYPSILVTNVHYKVLFVYLIGKFTGRLTFKACRDCRTFGGLSISPRELLYCIQQAFGLIKKINKKSQVLDISIDGIHVGDLIYDTFMKSFRKAEVEVKSFKLFLIILLAHVALISQKKMFDKVKFHEIYLSHSVYLSYGILGRLALKYNVDVYFYANNRAGFYQKMTADYPHHATNFAKLKHLHSKLSFSVIEAGREKGRKILERRLTGSIDRGISYMNKSSYTASNLPIDVALPFPDSPIFVLYLHDFLDAPHSYDWMVFTDFLDWVNFVIACCESNHVNLLIKQHPNAVNGNSKYVRQLTKGKRSLVLLPKEISTTDILSNFRVNLHLTIFGTVAHELAFLGEHVLCCGDNPHVSFDFVVTAKDLSEVNYWLKAFQNGVILPPPDKNEVLDFFYIFFIYPNEISFQGVFDDNFHFLNIYGSFKPLFERHDVKSINKLIVEFCNNE